MTRIDQFESVFKAASKPVFHYEAIAIKTVWLLTDLAPKDIDAFVQRAKSFLHVLESKGEVEWVLLSREDWDNIDMILERVEKEQPDLICTYRNLYGRSTKPIYSLGEAIDVLSQATLIPVMLLPHPRDVYAHDEWMKNTDRVMAVTDHLAGNDLLVNTALAFTEEGNRLFLTHIEEESTFNSYIDTIAKIASIDTEPAREAILKQRLKEPADYVISCVQKLKEQHQDFEIEGIVEMGDLLMRYKRLIEEHNIDLLVLNAKHDDQVAMHGLAYALAIELRELPLLML